MQNIPFIVACDFNAGEKPMSWVIGQKINTGIQQITFWHKALSYQFTNTLKMCEILGEDYFSRFTFGYPREIIFYGDYAGKKHTSNSSFNDWEIIQNYFHNKAVISLNTRPCLSIRDSIGATNAQLRNTKGEIRQFLDPDNCKELIKDWEYCSWKDNGRELDDRDPLRTHLCRAVDYYNEFEFSTRGKQETQSFRTI